MNAAPGDAEESTRIVPMLAATEDPTQIAGEDRSGRSWFDQRLRAFLDAMAFDRAGRPRSSAERQTLARAARDLIDRVGWDDPGAPSGHAALHAEQLLANTYVVRTLIARGGVGEIYRARHRDLHTDHAIKILLPRHMLDTTVLTLMLDEARLLQSVHHDGVVGCQGLLRDADGRLFLVMDYLRGRTLSARLQDGLLSEPELISLLGRLASALTAIHAAQIVHQDLSPDNIILRDDSCAAATIIDFGLARSLAEPEETRMLVDFAGKYAWVSPEQLTGREGRVDTRSDLYSLGLVIAAAARGQRLEMGHDPDTARAARQGVPKLDGISPAMREWLQRLLAPDPAKRFQTAQALLDGMRGEPARTGLLSRLLFRRSRTP